MQHAMWTCNFSRKPRVGYRTFGDDLLLMSALWPTSVNLYNYYDIIVTSGSDLMRTLEMAGHESEEKYTGSV